MVERYNVDVEKNDNGYWEGVLFISAGGEYVRYSDYADLAKRLEEAEANGSELLTLAHMDGANRATKALRAELEAVKANAETVCNSYADENQRLYDRAEASEARVAVLEAANERLRKSEDTAYRIIGRLEAYAIEDIMYDGRPVAAWCADYAARAALSPVAATREG